MAFYLDPSFFVLLAVAVVGAAWLGLRERPLRTYGLVVSAIFIALLFWDDAAGALSFLLFLALSLIATYVLFARPGSRPRFYVGLVLILLPLVTYKLTHSFGLSADIPSLLGLTGPDVAGVSGAVAGAGGSAGSSAALVAAPGTTAGAPSDSGGAGILGFMGISYLTFKALQVLIEMHDGLIQRMRVRDYLAFMLFFPVFTSGPIDRSRRFLADIEHVPSCDEYAGLLGRGILLVLLGMVYSMVLAPICHKGYVPQAWGSGPLGTELLAQVKCAYAYALYLFFDFAGAGFMAMGAGYCLGVRVPRNFHAPFLATDLKDFWNRWNMTLSFWLRDFVFMRFSRMALKHRWFKSNLRCAQVGLVLNMLVMGVWHGLVPGYLVYGLYHGLLLAGTEGFEKRPFYKRHHRSVWFRVVSWFVTLQLVVIGLAIFSGQMATMLHMG